MKKVLLIILLCLIYIPNVYALDLTKNAKSSILIEESTGEIIYEKNKDERLAPASMTKIMSLIIIMEELNKGNIKLDEEITISKNAASMGGSQIYLEENEKMTVKDLIKGIAMASANDAVVALAERISGTEEAFVFRMNQKARKLKLRNTNFKNATGLDKDDHYSSAYDMSIMARELIKYKEILNYSSKYEDYLRTDSEKKFWLVNTNKLIKMYDGMDGLKTGYTEKAKYCLTATAKKNKMRLIGVVMGEESSNDRNEEMKALLDYGFNLYNVKNLVKENKVISKYNNSKMKNTNVGIVSSKDINIINKKGSKKRKVSYKVKINRKKLPIKKGEVVGKLLLYENNNVISKINVTVNQNVYKASFFCQLFKNIINHLTYS